MINKPFNFGVILLEYPSERHPYPKGYPYPKWAPLLYPKWAHLSRKGTLAKSENPYPKWVSLPYMNRLI